jgi:hypothetical protein
MGSKLPKKTRDSALGRVGVEVLAPSMSYIYHFLDLPSGEMFDTVRQVKVDAWGRSRKFRATVNGIDVCETGSRATAEKAVMLFLIKKLFTIIEEQNEHKQHS